MYFYYFILGYVLDSLPSLCDEWKSVTEQINFIKRLPVVPTIIVNLKVSIMWDYLLYRDDLDFILIHIFSTISLMSGKVGPKKFTLSAIAMLQENHQNYHKASMVSILMQQNVVRHFSIISVIITPSRRNGIATDFSLCMVSD